MGKETRPNPHYKKNVAAALELKAKRDIQVAMLDSMAASFEHNLDFSFNHKDMANLLRECSDLLKPKEPVVRTKDISDDPVTPEMIEMSGAFLSDSFPSEAIFWGKEKAIKFIADNMLGAYENVAPEEILKTMEAATREY